MSIYNFLITVERRKITRKITAAEKKIAAEGTTAEEIQEAQANIEEYKRQLNYVVYFPKLEPYVSILTTEPLSEKGAATRTEIYDSINKAVADRNLPQITTHNPTKALFDPKNRNGHAKSTQQAKPQNKDKKDKSEPETAKMEEGGFNDLFFVLDKAGDNSQQDADTLADAPVVKNSSKKRAIIGGKEGEGISSDHTKKRKIKELVKSHKKSKGAQ
ncbi:hypothetical protein SARC_13516 [Sphaeroforma arctica JP610]|uniref:rRNA-processing protein EFG1 n=1 Tax=Sphaeroforma arctica JP610 TaxID=667725 RepID=A0A0L0FAY6_9EUKA|nr:hypothetical protein SARC_13516 [Sphaeroforma arctica JP610]KNC73925.1 hypothetical protein SARC_13516 [Sphaeroforma arctica JP610]|eukprot:XP_014147827.1 hypothetical protein SARC_13516 [Sphaeroforma arctica JP610]